jgi:hypothetical protein
VIDRCQAIVRIVVRIIVRIVPGVDGLHQAHSL